MDPLALLSDDDEDDADGGGSPAVSPSEGPDPKRARTQDSPSSGVQLDFEALRRAGYGDSKEDEERHASEALQASFAAFEQGIEAEKQKSEDLQPEGVSRTRAQEQDVSEFGCELPPDSVEVWDEQGFEQPDPWPTFEDAETASPGIHKTLVEVMLAAGFTAPTPIQANCWPILCSGRDLIGVAKTGSGKTLAFLLPFFSKLISEGKTVKESDDLLPAQMRMSAAGAGAYSPDILVMAPSRELALQIETEANKFTSVVGISALACYGGEGLRRQQIGKLREQPQCVVATCGRLNDFLENEKHWFSVRSVRLLVLDEGDLMIGQGLTQDIRKITCDVENPRRQTALFSATFPQDVSDIATWITRHAVEVRVGMKDPLKANRDIDQKIIIVKNDGDKEGALKSLVRKQFAGGAKNPGKTLIFAFDHEECDMLTKKLKAILNTNVQTLHGHRKQADREKAMAEFRSGEAPVMIATEIAGRGLDVKDIQFVINYDPPEDGMDYVHRIGRTARAGRKGTAVTLLRKGPDGRAMIYIAQVMRRTGLDVPKELVDALKQRRGRDMCLAVETLQGLCSFEKVERNWA